MPPSQPPPAGPRPFGIDSLLASGFDHGTPCAQKSRLVNWAVRTSDITQQVEHARACGYDPGDAAAMQRTRPDGSVLRWQLTTGPYEARWNGLLPFLIDWGASPHPSSGLPPGLEWKSFRGESPRPAEAASMLAALGASLDIRHGPHHGLRALLRGPSGILELN